MNIERAFELAYQQLPNSPYGKQLKFRKIIGLMLLMRESFSNPLVHVERDLDNEGVIYSHQNNNKSEKVSCSDAPEYEDKVALKHWLEMKILNVEEKLGSEIFKSIPNNSVQGKAF